MHVIPGTIVEVLNPDFTNNSYWVAEIIETAGLKIHIQYIGIDLRLWLNATDIYPVGHCISQNKKNGFNLKITKHIHPTFTPLNTGASSSVNTATNSGVISNTSSTS